MVKIISLLMCLCMVLGLCACGSNGEGGSSSTQSMTADASSDSSKGTSTENVSSVVSQTNSEQGSSNIVSSDNNDSNVNSSVTGNTQSNNNQSKVNSSIVTSSTTTTSSTTSNTVSSNTSSVTSTPPTPPQVNVVNTYGNTGSNLYNGGFVAGQGDWIYFINPSDNGYLYKMRTDGTGKQKLIDVAPKGSINVVGDWVYFFHLNSNDESCIYKVSINGTETSVKQVHNYTGTTIFVTNDYIFFRKEKLSVNFNDSTELLPISTSMSSLDSSYNKEYIFFSNSKDNYTFWRIKYDGTNMEKYVNRQYYVSPLITEKYSVFNNNNRGIRVYDSAITTTVLIPDNTLEPFAIDDENNKIYYLQSFDNRLICQDLITKEIQRFDAYATNINMVGDYIYYYNYDMAGKLYRIKKDGTGKEAV